MSEFKAFAPGVEVNGETVLSVVSGLGTFESLAHKLLADHRLRDPQPGHWYAQQAWLDVFEAIAAKIGSRSLMAIGRQIPESAQWRPTVDSLEKALGSIGVAYHMNHPGGEIGH